MEGTRFHFHVIFISYFVIEIFIYFFSETLVPSRHITNQRRSVNHEKVPYFISKTATNLKHSDTHTFIKQIKTQKRTILQ